jgi:hypothetical protein
MLLKKKSKHHPRIQSILDVSKPSPMDVQGSYTGIVNDKDDKPVQDADDL